MSLGKGISFGYSHCTFLGIRENGSLGEGIASWTLWSNCNNLKVK